MTSAPAVPAETTTLLPARDERLVAYSLVALGGLGAAIVTGQAALAALATPFVLVLAVALRRLGPLRVTARVVLDADQVLEGDLVTGRIEIEWDGALEADLMLDRLRGVAAMDRDDPLFWTLPKGVRPITIPVRLRASRWGRHPIGEVWLRVRAPLSLVCWTGRVASAPSLRVLPGRERLTRLLDPAESHAVLGAHLSRRLGDGHEFAEIRPYSPGDRLRDLNWRASARHRRVLVNRHHPERSGDVVIAIDAIADGSEGSTDAVARAARAAWALASAHLQANDRVGILGLGGRTRWLPPAGGRRAKYRLLETMLDIGGEVATSAVRPDGHARVAVPPAALIVALTALHDPGILGALEAWRAKGRSVVVIRIDTADRLPEPANVAEALARRIWAMEIERYGSRLAALGIPVVTIAGSGPVAPAVSALRRARKAPALRTRR